MSVALQLPVHYSLQEFLAWQPGDRRRYELVDGQPRAMAPTSTVHGFLQAELSRLIGNHLRKTRPDCEVINNPGVVPQVLSNHNFRVPDIGVTCATLNPTQLMLPSPLLLVEILSPSNQADTWSNVWTYTSIGSVQEILVLHTARVEAEVLRRTREGSWPGETEKFAGGDLALRSIEFQVAIADLYARSGLTTP